MNLWDWLIAAALFVLVLFSLAVLFDWLNYMDLQRRLREQRTVARVRSRNIELKVNVKYVDGKWIALKDIRAFELVVVNMEEVEK